MERSEDGHWTPIRRHMFVNRTASLAPLVVVSGTHGWGKTTWMRQYEQYVREHTGIEPQWARSRVELESALSVPPGGTPKAVFADMLIPTENDPLWDVVYRFVQSNPESIVVTSCIDRIAPEIITRCRAREVYERTLGFSFDELGELLTLNAPDVDPQEVMVLEERFRGNPYLVRKHIERLNSSHGSELWNSPDSPTELLLIRQYQAFGRIHQDQSCYLQLLLEGAGFRRFDATMLPCPERVSDNLRAAQFERLEMSPLGTFEVDPDTGRDTFEWSLRSWQTLQQEFPARATEEARLAAFRRTVDSGATTLALFYLLDLKKFAEAEGYVDRNLRLFLLRTPEVVENQLFALPQVVLDDHPNLAILTGELLTRAERSSARVRQVYQHALAKLKQRVDVDVRERYQTLVRKAFCRVSVGDREGANRRLDDLLDLLGTEEEPGPVLVAALTDNPLAQSLADELYLPFWTATQLDRHHDALQLVRLMRTWTKPDSPTAVATTLTIAAEEVFAGYVPAYPDSIQPVAAHADALQLLEQGRGEEALALVRVIDSRRTSSRTRSAAEALVLTVRALEEPGTLTLQQIDEAVERSRRFWTDGLPSTFVAQAASLAYLALHRPDLSREVLSEFRETDWFLAVGNAVERLVSGYGSAVDAISGLYLGPDVPRAEAVADIIMVASYASMGQDEAACLRLNSLWMKSRASLIRYALRFVPSETFSVIYGYRDRLHDGLVEVLEQAAGDPHVLVNARVPSLSKSELETLELLRGARTYSEVAAARFVSINTVRTQVKALYRKLEVKGRDEAIAKAEKMGLLR